MEGRDPGVHGDAYGHADKHTDRYPDAHADEYSHGHTDGYADLYSHGHTDGDAGSGGVCVPESPDTADSGSEHSAGEQRRRLGDGGRELLPVLERAGA